VPLVIHNLVIGLTYRLGEIPSTAHPRVGRWAVVLWSVSLALGLVVYLLLNVLY
jgi:putative membrane protein